MADKTGIQWTDSTWTPIAAYDRETNKRGWFCTKVSPGCTSCYAEKINQRLGNGHLYRVGNLGKIEFQLVNLEQPLRWKRPRRIFVCSMTDLFHEAVPDEFIDQVFAVMAMATQHTFQVLTKRPERMAAYMTKGVANRIELAMMAMGGWAPHHIDRVRAMPLDNVWLGTSTEDQQRYDERIKHLMATPAAVRFLSVEPQLGPIDLGLDDIACRDWEGRKVDWVIVGGESGSGARPFDVSWAASIIRQCRDAGAAPFVKQLGAWVEWQDRHHDHVLHLRDSKGGDWTEWPPEVRVREFPEVAACR